MRKWVKIFLYLVPIVCFFSVSVIWVIHILNSNFFYEYQLYFDSIYFLLIGCSFWAIVLIYFKKNKTTQIRSVIKSISLLYIFWLNLIVLCWIAGIPNYWNFWFIIHIFLILWLSIGLIIFLVVILFSFSSSIKSRFYIRFQRLTDVKFIRILDKFEMVLLLFIQTILGIYLVFSNITSHIRIFEFYQAYTFIIIITIIIVTDDLLFLFNFILSLKKSKDIYTPERKELLYLITRRKIDKKSPKYSKKSLEKIIKILEEGIEYFKIKESKEDNRKLRTLNLSLINAYENRGKLHHSNSLKLHKKSLLYQAQDECNFALNDFQACLDLGRSVKFNHSIENYEQKTLNLKLTIKKLEIEILILETDKKLKEVKNLQKKDIPRAIEMINSLIRSYSDAKEKAEQSNELVELVEKLQLKIQNAQLFRSQMQEKMDEAIGLKTIPSILNERDRDSILSVIREYEFIGGQIRFKVGVINNTSFTFTSLRLAFDLPEALKWIIHEPNYERKGDSILIAKLGAHEKKALSLYLEPINCMESSVNVTVSFFDAKDKPHAIPMKPKMVVISCPIFFTENEANLARVKSLHRSLDNRDKKVFPIPDPEKGALIFSSILIVLGKFDIKLVYKEFDDENNFGEAWFYGITKVNKNRIIPYVMLDSENKVLELEVSGDNAEQITAFLAEVSDRVRKQLIHDNVIKPGEKFYDMRITVMSNFCPYCFTLISSELVQKFLSGKSIQCKNCYAKINLDER